MNVPTSRIGPAIVALADASHLLLIVRSLLIEFCSVWPYLITPPLRRSVSVHPEVCTDVECTDLLTPYAGGSRACMSTNGYAAPDVSDPHRRTLCRSI